MKSAHAWVACSLVSASFVFVSCGSDDGTKKVIAPEGGTGGGAGEPAMAAGGQTTRPVIPVTEAGAGGAPPIVVASGGAGGAMSGGGEGGQPTPPLCFDLLDQSEGGAGGMSAGGAPAAVPPPQPAFRFRCDDLNVGYVLDAQQNLSSFTLGLKQGSGLLPATGGHFTFNYNYFDGETEQTVCSDQPTALGSTEGFLQVPAQEGHTVDQLIVSSLSVTDECNNEITLDTSSTVQGYCFLPRIYAQNGSWFIQCYEGYGTDCDPTCPVP